MNKLNAARPGANDCPADIFWGKSAGTRQDGGKEIRAAAEAEHIALEWHATAQVIDWTERARSDERRDG
ncbi:hypothetical protein [Burkholderia sp. Tr-20390]|uniref:hypothetical protein n=1 Tax=Burkholderia sp. Tr-20390 TaxID=2703904 RepID=UPI00197E8D68|nr:hypothetical protein [Burkholderia sp. Tr-20390]MBN3730833.1 hypothetical protein [Burkholderia sp. Tr-20390]